jgi:hypothetical protein
VAKGLILVNGTFENKCSNDWGIARENLNHNKKIIGESFFCGRDFILILQGREKEGYRF